MLGCLGIVDGDELPNTVDSFAIRVVASRRRLIARDSDEVLAQEQSSAILQYPGAL